MEFGRILIFPLILLLAACPSSPSTRVQELAIRGPFEHASGMVFPERAGEFVRSSVTKFSGSENNFGIAYRLTNPGVLVTIFVYPTEDATLDDHFEQIVNDVVKTHGARPLQQSPIEVTQKSALVRGRAATWEYSQQFGASVVSVRSRAFLLQRGPWFVKYRVTNNLAAESTIREMVARLLQELPMPSGT